MADAQTVLKRVRSWGRFAPRWCVGRLVHALHPWLLNQSLTIWVYHSVTDQPCALDQRFNLNVPPNVFEDQVRFLKRHFSLITADDLLRDNLPPRAALITFDDGLRSYFDEALPILIRHDAPSLIYLNMGPVRGEIFWSAQINMLCDRPDFLEYLERNCGPLPPDRPAFLACSRTIVESYLADVPLDIEAALEGYVGPFAREQDLAKHDGDPRVAYGNHLYNHDVPRLLSDEELLDSYQRNATALAAFRSYRPHFAFPFGEPDECFTAHQVDLLLAHGAVSVASCSGAINRLPTDTYLHRTQALPHQTSAIDLWYQLLENLPR